MLPKKKRINKKLFESVMKSPKVLQGSFFVFKYIKQTQPKYAFVVPKNICKIAVKRNKYRRIGFNILKNQDIKENFGIFFYKKEGLKTSKNNLENDIFSILNKIK